MDQIGELKGSTQYTRFFPVVNESTGFETQKPTSYNIWVN